MSVKLDFECSYCNKILKNPLHLPCICDTICAEHLKDSDVIKEKCIECNKCKEVFPLNENDFKSNRIVQNLLAKEIYLSDEEKNLKKSLESKLNAFYVRVEQLEQNINVAQTESHNHFQEIRRKLDLHREELKEKIDKIYFEMIDQTKEKENSYASRIASLSYKGEIQTLEKEIHSANEAFRHLNVSLDSIQRMADERNATNLELEMKLIQLDKLKEYLKKSNEFEPNLEFDKDVFGRLYLNEYFSKKSGAELEDEEDDEEDEYDENENGDEDEEEEEVEEYEYEDDLEDNILPRRTV